MLPRLPIVAGTVNPDLLINRGRYQPGSIFEMDRVMVVLQHPVLCRRRNGKWRDRTVPGVPLVDRTKHERPGQRGAETITPEVEHSTGLRHIDLRQRLVMENEFLALIRRNIRPPHGHVVPPRPRLSAIGGSL